MKKVVSKLVISIYLVSVFAFSLQMTANMPEGDSKFNSTKGLDVTATDLGVMCITTAYPSVGIEMTDSRDNEDIVDNGRQMTNSAHDEVSNKTENKMQVVGEPKVLIVHTHATESYLPSSEGNFHRRDEQNTVRDVGNVIAAELEAKGIGVIHDKTLHDYPSYNSSYSRSYQTVSAILTKYPSIECVIDLHRDAVSSESPAQTVSIGGKTCAKYSYVIGSSASTYSQNRAFVNKLNGIAAGKYNGFTGAVIERVYTYNQELSPKYLLVEIGFNRNQIEDCRNTAGYFGKILAEGIS